MRFGPVAPWFASTVLVSMVLVSMTGCASRAPQGPGVANVPETHVVRRDETLYRIATRNGLDWRDVARRNGIGPPYLIYPGQRIRLAGAAGLERRIPQVAPAQPATATRSPAPAEADARAEPVSPVPAPGTATPASRRPAASTTAATTSTGSTGGPPQWHWPADGPLLRAFSNSASTRRGLAIGGQRGDEVRAATDGEVVYAGSGLVGYGRLIIIKHDARFISAYGHNAELLVREGQTVRAGQRIASLGDSGADRPMLHFEIRVDGTPVDPTRYLPRR